MRVNGFLAFTTVLTLHLQVLTVVGYPLTMGAITGTVLLSRLITRISISLWAALSAVAIVVVVALPPIVHPGYVDATEYVKTLVLLLAAIALFGFVLSEVSPSRLRGVAAGLEAALWVVVGLSIIQVITGAAGSEVFFNPWGPLQYLYQYNPYLQFNPVPRASGFYLEPSYNAFVMGSVVFAHALLQRFTVRMALLGMVGLLCVQSATAFFILAVLLSVVVILSRRKVILALFVLAASLVFFGEELGRRLGSISDFSSSGNYRIAAPLPVMQDILSSSPLGLPLGSIARVLSGYDLRNGDDIGVSLDNGFYVIVFYFGWAGVGLLAVLAVISLTAAVRLSRLAGPLTSMAPLWFYGTLFFSGGVLLPEYVIVTGLGILAIRSRLSVSCPALMNRSPDGHPEYRLRHLSRR
jgi:putative colanic acid polymerase